MARYTIARIKELLKQGYSFFTEATSMVNGGTHRWWIIEESNKEISFHCFGRGPGWMDQSDEVQFTDLDSFAKAIYHKLGKRHAEWPELIQSSYM